MAARALSSLRTPVTPERRNPGIAPASKDPPAARSPAHQRTRFMNESVFFQRSLAGALALTLAAWAASPAHAQPSRSARTGDYIAVVVNQELVTAGEVQRRLDTARAEAARAGQRLPPETELRQQVMDSLIDERVIITNARESGVRIDEPDIDRAVQNVAAQNQITPAVLRERLRAEGIDYSRFRSQLRDQLMMERLREREVYRRIQVSDEEVDKFLAERRSAAQGEAETNIAQILVPVPEGTTPEAEALLLQRAQAALQRVRDGEDFAKVVLEVSADPNRETGGALGLRPASRLPDAFVEATRGLAAGQVAPELLRTGAGFHVLKVVERRDAGEPRVTQTRARHVLLRPSAQLTAEVASRRLADYKRQIEAGTRKFEDIARQFSEDGSAAAGGDLGWNGPGVMVPEFEVAMDALPLGGLSAPVPSRFGVHLIQVLERRQVAVDPKALREQARNVLREQRFDQAYLDWTKEMRARAYVEMREPPP
jgi:peptidyl-prolyl cis-trans isomerase SurA